MTAPEYMFISYNTCGKRSIVLMKINIFVSGTRQSGHVQFLSDDGKLRAGQEVLEVNEKS
jgi:hypothetical protein